MTEESSIKDDDYLVRVKAQVMTRDDSTGGWVPMGGGGMSIVGLRKLVISTADDIRHEYLIHGQRIADQSVVLNCVLKKDVQYTKAIPTFHHWKTEEKRFGLTFQSSADARAFDKGVKRAVEDLMEGSPDSNANDLELGDDEVFMALDLPLGRKDSSSQSASTASTTTSSPTGQSPALCSIQDPFTAPPPSHYLHNQANHHHLHRVHYITRHPRLAATSPQSSELRSLDTNGRPEEVWIRTDKPPPQHVKPDGGGPNPDENIEVAMDYSYVQFARNRPTSVHEYTYPTLDSLNKPPSRRDSLSSLKKHNIEMLSTQPPLPTKSKKRGKGRNKDKKYNRHLLSQRDRCVYCNEMFDTDENARGNCVDAPDQVAQCIEKVACICCARGMLYHCMADADGDYGHPCVCDSSEENNCKKWTALTILSLFVPCLWCYWPLTACHRLGMTCGCCGGKHKATK